MLAVFWPCLTLPDLTLDGGACAVGHLPSYFLLSVSCHLNPWVLNCCHLYLTCPLAICQTVQPSVLLWSFEILHLNSPCSHQGPLASNLGSQTDNLLHWVVYLPPKITQYVVDLYHNTIYCGFVWLELENMTEKKRPRTGNVDGHKNGNGKGLEFRELSVGMSRWHMTVGGCLGRGTTEGVKSHQRQLQLFQHLA